MKRMVCLSVLVAVGGGFCLSAASCDSLGPNGTADTGKLRILVTDKPFPFDLIEEALVTVTRVEVRLAGSEDECTADADCDDGAFCDGAELCVEGECEEGEEPCLEGESCDEDSDVCVSEGAGEPKRRVQMQELPEGVDFEADEELDDEAEEEGDEEDDDGGAFVTVFEGERTLNLLELQNGRTDLLADADIRAGTYTQMRLIVTEGQVTLKDGAGVFDLVVPSGAQTGIKLHFSFEVSGDEVTTLLLDVDVSELFTPVPGGMIEDPTTIERFLFRPSVAMRLINLLEAGSVSGMVTDADGTPLADVAVTAYAGGEDVTSTSTDADGTYMLVGLPAGDYTVEFSLSGYENVSVADVMVTAEETTTGVDAVMVPAP